ncbi:MAG TPA: VWA domain-containing protein [Candidatus Binataceae bacterium]|nr:VWA domain-containing protein [Candidatus Binataceae bacterium]
MLRGGKRYGRRYSRTAPATICLAILLAGASPAVPQQGELAAPPSIIHGQGDSVLEVPAAPASQGGKDTPAIPQLAPQQGPALELPSRALRSQSGYEQLTVTVTDQGGRYVTGLQKGDFRIYVDGIQRPLEFLRRDANTPVSIGILVDTSGSMEPKISQARAAIVQFIRDLNANDDIFLYAFSDDQFLLQPFTTNHELVMRRLGLLHAYGDTAIFDTIIDGLHTVNRGRYDKKALLVVTDGMDNASRATLPQVVGRARRMGVLIYSIGIGNPSPTRTGLGFGIGPLMFGGNRDHVDAAMLRALSTESGARTYLLGEVGDGELLRQDCTAISNELREQYTAGFVVPDPSMPGYRSLRVDIPGRPELTVRTRKGVTVSPGAPPAYAGASVPNP